MHLIGLELVRVFYAHTKLAAIQSNIRVIKGDFEGDSKVFFRRDFKQDMERELL